MLWAPFAENLQNVTTKSLTSGALAAVLLEITNSFRNVLPSGTEEPQLVQSIFPSSVSAASEQPLLDLVRSLPPLTSFCSVLLLPVDLSLLSEESIAECDQGLKNLSGDLLQLVQNGTDPFAAILNELNSHAGSQ